MSPWSALRLNESSSKSSRRLLERSASRLQESSLSRQAREFNGEVGPGKGVASCLRKANSSARVDVLATLISFRVQLPPRC